MKQKNGSMGNKNNFALVIPAKAGIHSNQGMDAFASVQLNLNHPKKGTQK